MSLERNLVPVTLEIRQHSTNQREWTQFQEDRGLHPPDMTMGWNCWPHRHRDDPSKERSGVVEYLPYTIPTA